jgi:hypothetical protein
LPLSKRDVLRAMIMYIAFLQLLFPAGWVEKEAAKSKNPLFKHPR